MSQQVNFIRSTANDQYLKTLSLDYTSVQAEGLWYESGTDAASVATYATTTTGIPHVVIGGDRPTKPPHNP